MKLVTVVLLTVAIGACGGSGSSSQRTFNDLTELAKALNEKGISCTNVTTSEKTQILAKQSGNCDLEGEKGAGILVFATAEASKSAASLGKQFGGVCAYGKTWAVCSKDRARAERVAAALGGETPKE